MTLDLDKSVIYANPYYTNWYYLRNMTALQMKALEKMELKGGHRHKYINADLWPVPWAGMEEKSIKDSVKGFIENLNEKIMEM